MVFLLSLHLTFQSILGMCSLLNFRLRGRTQEQGMQELLKRLGAASFVPDPGLESLQREECQTVGRKALQIAFQKQKEYSKAS